jgi:sugar-specific transcriptional regulator TrmB
LTPAERVQGEPKRFRFWSPDEPLSPLSEIINDIKHREAKLLMAERKLQDNIVQREAVLKQRENIVESRERAVAAEEEGLAELKKTLLARPGM